MAEILSIAIFEIADAKDEEAVLVLRELLATLRQKGYSRDIYYRDSRNPRRLVNLRWWASAEARQAAHEDPDVYRYWAQLGHLINMEKVYESLEEIGEAP